MTDQQWWVFVNNKVQGPFPSSKIIGYAKNGRISPETPISNDGGKNFVAAEKIKGLFATDQVNISSTGEMEKNKSIECHTEMKEANEFVDRERKGFNMERNNVIPMVEEPLEIVTLVEEKINTGGGKQICYDDMSKQDVHMSEKASEQSEEILDIFDPSEVAGSSTGGVYCHACGKPLTGAEAFCSACGTALAQQTHQAGSKVRPRDLVCFYVASAIIPIFGVVAAIYLYFKQEPQHAKRILLVSLVMFFVWAVLMGG